MKGTAQKSRPESQSKCIYNHIFFSSQEAYKLARVQVDIDKASSHPVLRSKMF